MSITNHFTHGLGCVPCHSRFGIWTGNESTHHAACHVVCRDCGTHDTVTANMTNTVYVCYDCTRRSAVEEVTA